MRAKIIDKLYDKIFNARNEIEEEQFWKKIYKTKLELSKKGITDLEDWLEMRYYNKLIKLVKEELNIDTFHGLKILELGSGSGLLSLLMAKEGASVILVDKLKEATEYSSILLSKLKVNRFEGRVKIINSDMFSLNLSLNNFDIVHNYGVIEHFSYNKIIKIVRLMKNYSKKEGFVIISVPNYFSPDTIFLWRKYRKGTEKYYSKSELKRLLEKIGLKKIKVITSTSVYPYFFPRWFVEKTNFIENFLGKKIGLGFLHIGVGKK